jgi:hypothetical protein
MTLHIPRAAVAANLPRDIRPQIASSCAEPPAGEGRRYALHQRRRCISAGANALGFGRITSGIAGLRWTAPVSPAPKASNRVFKMPPPAVGNGDASPVRSILSAIL